MTTEKDASDNAPGTRDSTTVLGQVSVSEHTTHCPNCNANWLDSEGYGTNCMALEYPHYDGIWSWSCLKCEACFPTHAQKQYNVRRAHAAQKC